MKKLLLVLIFIFSTAMHPIKTGEIASLTSWCSAIQDLEKLVTFVALDNLKKYMEYVQAPGNTCIDIRIAMGDANARLSATVIKVVKTVKINNNFISLVELETKIGSKIYSWHFLEGIEVNEVPDPPR